MLYNGTTYRIPLEPQNNMVTIDGKTGGVCDLKWKLTGKQKAYDTESIHYYGGSLEVWDLDFSGTSAIDNTTDGLSKVSITFTPRGAIIDGTTPAPFTREVTATNGTFGITDVPIGSYTITAKFNGKTAYIRYVTPGQTQLHMESRNLDFKAGHTVNNPFDNGYATAKFNVSSVEGQE